MEIIAGRKRYEYRAYSDYYHSRLRGRSYDRVRFYSKDSRMRNISAVFELKDVTVGEDPDDGSKCYILSLGEEIARQLYE